MTLLSVHVRSGSITATVAGGGAAVFDLTRQTPADGRLEQSPEDVWRALLAVTRSVLDHSPAPTRVAVVSDPTLVVWDQETLGAARPAVLSEDERGAATGRTSGPGAVLAWLAVNEPHTWALVHAGRYAVGTVESYVVARMTRGTWHVTDPGHARRLGLTDPATGAWDAPRCAALDVPLEALPEILATGEGAGVTDPACFHGLSLPVTFASP
ncbi:hypothetical protein G7072_06815 [Nocardioides sp. HDW12B]|uniref:FGGY family carbohydrate kinase n=1 Tax=Nocardioides sp. HDW12B TaxID=2714939 RepID=UPI001407A14F|nr:FGGY family carbohydrate kinase [Nocardioides sp. HDW12B]QIK66091.1 hypothetical protein G7072_06815 [Nocardioides sp. HDW12B]